MQIRQILHSDEELIARFGRRFFERLKGLLAVYREHYRDMACTKVYKLANLAFMFCSLSASNGVEAATTFENMLYGRGQDVLMLDECPFVFNDGEEHPAVGMFWDASCLLMEEETDFEKPQWLYDFLDRHQQFAYSLTALPVFPEDSVPTVAKEGGVVTVAQVAHQPECDLYMKGQQDAVQKVIDMIKGSKDLHEMGSGLETLLSRLSRKENHVFDAQLDDLSEWNMQRSTGNVNIDIERMLNNGTLTGDYYNGFKPKRQ